VVPQYEYDVAIGGRDRYQADFNECRSYLNEMAEELISCQEGADLLTEMWEETNKEQARLFGMQLQVMQEGCRSAIFEQLQAEDAKP
jgi:hypothetical protein